MRGVDTEEFLSIKNRDCLWSGCPPRWTAFFIEDMERRRLYNAYEKHEGYYCFGCAAANESGLRCEFYEEGEYVTCRWMPRPEFQGFFNVLHGGIQATLMDEIACWTVFAKVQSAGVTVDMRVKYRATVYTNRGELLLRSRITEQNSRLVTMHVELFNADGTLGSEADVVYRVFPPEVAEKRLGWTGIEAFRDPGVEVISQQDK